MLATLVDELLSALSAAAVSCYGERLVSLAVFGSVGRGTPNHASDVDLLLVARGLPEGRMARVREFGAVDHSIAPTLAAVQRSGWNTALSPILKTPEEVLAGSLLFLDMIEDLRILVDVDGFLAMYLRGLADRLARAGAKRKRWRGGWYWDLGTDAAALLRGPA